MEAYCVRNLEQNLLLSLQKKRTLVMSQATEKQMLFTLESYIHSGWLIFRTLTLLGQLQCSCLVAMQLRQKITISRSCLLYF